MMLWTMADLPVPSGGVAMIGRNRGGSVRDAAVRIRGRTRVAGDEHPGSGSAVGGVEHGGGVEREDDVFVEVPHDVPGQPPDALQSDLARSCRAPSVLGWRGVGSVPSGRVVLGVKVPCESTRFGFFHDRRVGFGYRIESVEHLRVHAFDGISSMTVEGAVVLDEWLGLWSSVCVCFGGDWGVVLL